MTKKINTMSGDVLWGDNYEQNKKRVSEFFDAMPLCANLWNSDYQNLMCNKLVLELFEIDTYEEYLNNFFKFSPEYQPDGRLTMEAFRDVMEEAKEKGTVTFNWLHINSKGEDLPSEVTLSKLDILDEKGEPLLAGFTRDLRPRHSSSTIEKMRDGYFHNYISDKKLIKTLSELSSEWFFAMDLRTMQMQFFGQFKDIYGITEDMINFPDYMRESGVIYQDDLELFDEISNNMKNGIEEIHDIRLVRTDGVERYHRIFYKTTFDYKGKPLFIIGKAFDIHKQKTLEVLSQMDQLTNCYNKVTCERLIAETIEAYQDGSHAMFIIDIDNFKAINDNLGHHFGDIVLSEIAANLHACFRDLDIIGRIGGDEFMVFLKNTRDINIIKDKAAKIAKAFQNTYSGENKDYKISGSIGISLYPKDGRNFEDLYKAADKALYQSKLQGKDTYTFYTHELAAGTMENRTKLENVSRIANTYFDAELISTVFDLLYETQDMDAALNAIMQFICKRTKSDRCYIFETFDEGKTYSNTYEWCNVGIPAEIDNLQNLTYAVLADFFESSDENGIFFSNDLSLLKADGAFELMRNQGIKSFLHVQTREIGYTKLFLGLDDCTKHRIWTEKEINSVMYALKMISIFFLSDKRKGKNRRTK